MLVFPRWKLILVLSIVVLGFLFAIPNLFSASSLARVPAWLPHKQVSLGLDLQGGAHLLYQLDENEMVEDWLNTLRGDVREGLRKARIGYTDLSQNVASRTVSSNERIESGLGNRDLQSRNLWIEQGHQLDRYIGA